MSSVTLVQPAKAAGHNEILFGRDSRVVPSNTVFDKDLVPWEGEIWGSEPPVRRSLMTLKPNTHRRRRHNSTVELSCVGVGGVY